MKKPLSALKITDDLKALTIHGPWAWGIIAGHKRVENRSWETPLRGRIAIHAGSSTASDERAIDCYRRLGLEFPTEFPRGVLIGTVEIVDILPQNDYLRRYGQDKANRLLAFGPLCWVLANPIPCRPIPCPGKLSLWNVKKTLASLR